MLILIRGLPGSGKSTLARELATRGFAHFEADMWFEQRGAFDPALEAGHNIVVSNTFIKRAELQPYLDAAQRFGVAVEIRRATDAWPSLHNVPDAVFRQMVRDFEA